MTNSRIIPLEQLVDIEKSIVKLHGFLQGKSQPEFMSDEITRLATERLLINIGEAMNNLRRVYGENDLSDQIPRFRKTLRFRNRLVHEYKTVTDEETWHYVLDHLPILLEAVRKLIEREKVMAQQEIRESSTDYIVNQKNDKAA